jgi:hypothetical protein
MPTEAYIAILSGVCAIIGLLITTIMNGISDTLKELNRNVADLNTKMGVMVERVDNHEKRLSHLESS